VDVRISSIPSTYGERIVMRLLDKSARVYKLSEIGLDKPNEEILRKYVKYTHGVIFVTGPTGSGKTTTLYAALTELNTQEKNILTIEDPVEYNLHGISQVQISMKRASRSPPDCAASCARTRHRESARCATADGRHRHPRSPATSYSPPCTPTTRPRPSAHARHRRRALPRVSSVLLCMAQRLVRHLPQVQGGRSRTSGPQELESVGLSLDRSVRRSRWQGLRLLLPQRLRGPHGAVRCAIDEPVRVCA
jgi:type II secretory ATPase GspE/PulE/Tfp pilus assembly ATPase PilB-like protein